MKQFKLLFLFGIVVLTVVGAMIVTEAVDTSTVDFSGRIVSISVSEDGTATLTATSIAGGDFTFRIDGFSTLEDCCGKQIEPTELCEGDMILIEYRFSLFKNKSIKSVRELTLFSH